jgi:hypothetical protein
MHGPTLHVRGKAMSEENRLGGALPTPDLVFRTKCHPLASGNTPLYGEQAWSFHFPLADGRNLAIELGRAGRDRFREFLMQEEADDATQRLLGP